MTPLPTPSPTPSTAAGAPELAAPKPFEYPAVRLGDVVQFTAPDGRVHMALVVTVHQHPSGYVNLVSFGQHAGDEACELECSVRYHPDPQFFNTWRKLPA